MIYIRIYSGVLKVGTEVHNPRLKRGEKISRIFQTHAHQRTPGGRGQGRGDGRGHGIEGDHHRRHPLRSEPSDSS